MSFTVACDRKFKDANGNKLTDFISCVAWRQTADFVAKYFTKGSKIALEGSIQTRSYTAQDGSKRYVTEVVADNVEFAGSNTRQQSAAGAPPLPDEPPHQMEMNGFTPIDDDELPF